MSESEKKIVEMMDERSPMSKYWMPLVWATNIINRARRESLISSDQVVQTLLVELSDIRRRLGSLISYDTVCVPLVYTQVSVTPAPVPVVGPFGRTETPLVFPPGERRAFVNNCVARFANNRSR